MEKTTREKRIREFALSLPGTYMTEQWGGSQVFKVGDAETFKMFGILLPGKGLLTVKTESDETRDLLIAAGVAQKNVHLPRGGWVQLRLDALDSDDVCDRIRTSYDVVLPGLPMRVRSALQKDG